jgi:hypothetical protein
MDRATACPIPKMTESSFLVQSDESAFTTTATYYSTTAGSTGSTGTSNAKPVCVYVSL